MQTAPLWIRRQRAVATVNHETGATCAQANGELAISKQYSQFQMGKADFLVLILTSTWNCSSLELPPSLQRATSSCHLLRPQVLGYSWCFFSHAHLILELAKKMARAQMLSTEPLILPFWSQGCPSRRHAVHSDASFQFLFIFHGGRVLSRANCSQPYHSHLSLVSVSA